jgi:hypothetical protein
MAILNATLTLASSDVTTDPLSFTLNKALSVKPPNIGVSRAVAPINTPTTLVPASVDNKYAYVKHMSFKSDGTTPSTNTVNIATIGDGAPVREVSTITLNADLVASNSVVVTVDGTALSAINYATSHAATLTAIATAIQATAGVLTATANGRVITITGANPGDPFTIAMTITGGASQASVGVAETTAASGAAFSQLSPGEFVFIPVKAGEGLSALASGTVSADGVLLEYAYFTKQ